MCLQVEEQYQREMGITAQQQRIDSYMRSRTVTGQAILDPTSRLHPYPSEAVVVKPAGFGLGRSSPEVVKKVARKHAGLQNDLHGSLLLPSKFRWAVGTLHVHVLYTARQLAHCISMYCTQPGGQEGSLQHAVQQGKA